MADRRDLLVEIGTEELPPRSLLPLAQALADGLVAGLAQFDLIARGRPQIYATPRRLAVLIAGVPERQADGSIVRSGPALATAFTADGAPTKAAQGFARSCGVTIAQLQRRQTDRGECLAFSYQQAGRKTADLLEAVIARALAALPMAKRMRWGDGDVEFVRPVHWVCVLLGSAAVTCEVLGITAGNTTRGHRFPASHDLPLAAAGDYSEILYRQGKVVADFARRRAIIVHQLEECARHCGGRVVMDEGLLDEVTALVEWPVAVVGSFAKDYLALPEEVLITTMQDHQKYFPLRDEAGGLLPKFITIANIASSNPDTLRRGNERVIRPRLADAQFFREKDRKQTLEQRVAALGGVLFHQQLGTLAEKSGRLVSLAGWISAEFGAVATETASAVRAARLAKCDLCTAMVGEFPALQGVVGEYYARDDGEASATARALREQYLPRFARDDLPTSHAGRVLAIADRADTLVGIFASGQKPSGEKDPFALRRAALAILRIIVAANQSLDLRDLLEQAAANFPPALNAPASVPEILDFTMERCRAHYAEQAIAPQVFEAVFSEYRGTRQHPVVAGEWQLHWAHALTEPLEFDRRIRALDRFARRPAAGDLAAASKRVLNILRKNHAADETLPLMEKRFCQPQEQALYAACQQVIATAGNGDTRRAELLAESGAARKPAVSPRIRIDSGAYLDLLHGLHQPLDDFFAHVMVITDDRVVRSNRLALLQRVAGLLTGAVDISRLSSGS